MLWSFLIHLGYNMWEEEHAPIPGKKQLRNKRFKEYYKHRNAKPILRCDLNLFREATSRMAEGGLNAVVIDLGEGVRYNSHPELAVRNSWTVKNLKSELSRLRKIGLEPIPKMNFATTHDEWLGPYSRCVSTDAYYGVCRDLIEEAVDIFEKPRFFHIGMDEETASHQRNNLYAVMRQHDLWWHDLYFLVRLVEKQDVRAWMWADRLWHNPDEFFRKMPKSVLQSNWYYGNVLRANRPAVKAYLDLEEKGYDQVPTGSNHSNDENFGKTVHYLKKRISPKRLKGFLNAPWRPTLPECRKSLLRASDLTGKAKSENGY